MIQIMYWNIQKFSAPKIKGKRLIDATVAKDRLAHIKKVVCPDPPRRKPDMIIVVEVAVDNPTAVKDLGAVLRETAAPAEGVLQLASHIRQWLGSSWCLIPPIPTGELGRCEAVAVYYDSNSLIFTGPYIYATDKSTKRHQLDKAMPPTQGNLDNLAPYDPAWEQYLPKSLNRTWDAPDGAKVPEWQGAGQFEYGNLEFPDRGYRRPFYTRMKEVNGNRTIKVFTVHTTPAVASGATRNIRHIPDVQAVGNDEVAVVVGDFNVDSFRGDPKFPNSALNTVNNPYEMLVTLPRDDGLGYQMLLNPCRPGTFSQHPNRKPYCLTLLLRNVIRANQDDEQAIATPYNAAGRRADPQHNVYPRFGYMGSYSDSTGEFSDTGALDNAFVKYGPNLAAVPHNTTIVNTVVGTPYNRLRPPPDGVTADLTGGYTQPSALKQPIPQPAGINPGADINGFNDYENYGLIRSVSDHLAIVFDV